MTNEEKQKRLRLLELEEEEFQYQQAQAVNSSAPNSKEFDLSQYGGDSGKAVLESMGAGDSGAGEAGLTGFVQNITFGGSDELGAVKDVALDVIKGKTGPTLTSTITGEDTSLSGKFRKYQKERELANKKLQESHPGAYLAGELAGTIATTPLMPTLGGAKLVGLAGRIGPKTAAFLASKSPQAMEIAAALKSGALTAEAAELALKSAPQVGSLAKIAGWGTKSALEAAPAGALYGWLASEADISKPKELAKDIASSAGVASLAGAGLSMAGGTLSEGFKAGSQRMDKTDYGRQLKKAYEYGVKHLSLGDSEVKDKLSEIPRVRSENLLDRVEDVRNELGKAVGRSIDSAQQSGVKIKLDDTFFDEIDKFSTLFDNNPQLESLIGPKATKFIKRVPTTETTLTPLDAVGLRDSLGESIQFLKGSPNPVDKRALTVAIDLQNNINQTIKNNIPEYAEKAKYFEEFHRLIPETILSKGWSPQTTGIYYGSLKNSDQKFVEAARTMLSLGQMSGTEADRARSTLNQIRKNLLHLDETQPETVKKFSRGLSGKDFGSKLRGQADELAMLHAARGLTPNDPPDLWRQGYEAISKLATGSKAPTLGAAHTLGKAVSGDMSKLTQRVYRASNDKLLQTAGFLKSSKVKPFAVYGDKLEQAILNKSESSKNAILNIMLQQPELRNLIKDMFQEE